MCVFVKSITDHHYRFQPAIFTKRPWMLGDSDLQERFGWRNVWLQFAGTINSYIHCFHSNLFGISYLVIDEIVSQARFSDINLHFIIKIKKKCNVRLSFFFFYIKDKKAHDEKLFYDRIGTGWNVRRVEAWKGCAYESLVQRVSNAAAVVASFVTKRRGLWSLSRLIPQRMQPDDDSFPKRIFNGTNSSLNKHILRDFSYYVSFSFGEQLIYIWFL